MIGFGGEILGKYDVCRYEIMKHIQPDDLVSFGFIPEIAGRLPVVVPLEDLDTDALVRILVEPKNALVRQYRKIFSMEGVELEFTDEALLGIASKAAGKNTGARGLRSILEGLMMDLMYEIPSNDRAIRKVVFTREAVEGSAPPLFNDERKSEEVA